jgi:hypothetical protein
LFSEPYIKFQNARISSNDPVTILISELELFDEFLIVYNDLQKKNHSVEIISLNYYLHPLFEKHGLDYKYIFEYSCPDDYFGLKEKAETLAKNWYLVGSKDITMVGEISLGLALEYGMGIFFQKIFKAIQDTQTFFNKVKPKSLIFLTREESEISFYIRDVEKDLYRRVLKYLAKKLDVPHYEFGFQKPKAKFSILKTMTSVFRFYPLTSPDLNKKTFLPQFLISTLKKTYFLINNLFAAWFHRSELPNVFFASPNTVSYFGKNLIQKICDSAKCNIYVYQGESRSFRMEIERCFLRNLLSFPFINKFRKSTPKRFQTFTDSSEIINKLTFEEIPLVSAFREEFYQVFENEMTNALKDFINYKHLMKKRSIQLLLVTSDLPARERTAVIAANLMGIPSLNLQHGIEGQTQSTPSGFPRKASHKAAWSFKRKDWLVRNGENPDSIDVVGCTLYDEVQKDISKILDFNSHSYLVYFTHPGQQFLPDRQIHVLQNERIMRVLLDTMKQLPQKTLVIKTRPMDEQGFLYKKWIEEAQCQNIVVTDSDLLYWIQASDMFFAIYSTAGVESMFFDKPGITFGFAEKEKVALYNNTGQFDIPFAEYGATLDLDIEDSSKLIQLIKSIYESSKTNDKLSQGRQKFLKDYCNYGEGNPADKFIQLMEKLIKQK